MQLFTGSDYTPSFTRKGKKAPFKNMCSNPEYLKAFKDLGCAEIIQDQTLKTLEKFVCQLYGDKKCNDVNELRHKKLVQGRKRRITKPKTPASQPNAPTNSLPTPAALPRNKIRRSNPASLPPCFATFEQQAFRTNLAANMWKQAPNANMKMWDIAKHGYHIVNGKCMIKWFEGPELPDITYRPPEPEEEEDCDSSDESGDSEDSDDSDEDMD